MPDVSLGAEMTIRNDLPKVVVLLERILHELEAERKERDLERLRRRDVE